MTPVARVNAEVEYMTVNPGSFKVFRGRVHAVYDEGVIVRHDTEPRYTLVKHERLTVLEPARHRYAGHGG